MLNQYSGVFLQYFKLALLYTSGMYKLGWFRLLSLSGFGDTEHVVNREPHCYVTFFGGNSLMLSNNRTGVIYIKKLHNNKH